MQAMTFACPWQDSQVSISMLNTRFNLFALVIEWRFSITVLFPLSDVVLGCAFFSWVIVILYWLFGANTPKNLVKFTLGLGTNSASFAIKSNGSVQKK